MSTPDQTFSSLNETKDFLNIARSNNDSNEKINTNRNSADNYVVNQIRLNADVPLVDADPELTSLASQLAAAYFNQFQNPMKTEMMELVKQTKQSIQDYIMETYGRKNPNGLSGAETFGITSGFGDSTSSQTNGDGASALSELTIDVSKDWLTFDILNVGNFGMRTTTPATVLGIDLSSLGDVFQNKSTQQALIVASGAAKASLSLIDEGAGIDEKWFMIESADGVSNFLGLTDSGSATIGFFTLNHSTGNIVDAGNIGVNTNNPEIIDGIDFTPTNVVNVFSDDDAAGLIAEGSFFSFLALIDRQAPTDEKWFSIFSSQGVGEIRSLNDSGSGGQIISVTISNGGTGYNTPSETATVTSVGGTGATGSLSIIGGVIVTVTPILGGTGFVQDEFVTITGDTSSATNAVCFVDVTAGAITAYHISRGSLYDEGETVQLTGVTSGSNDARGSITVGGNGGILTLNITTLGTGYIADEVLTTLGLSSGATNADVKATTVGGGFVFMNFDFGTGGIDVFQDTSMNGMSIADVSSLTIANQGAGGDPVLDSNSADQLLTLAGDLAVGAGTVATSGDIRLVNKAEIFWRDNLDTLNFGIRSGDDTVQIFFTQTSTDEFSFGPSSADWTGNNLINMGVLQFDNSSTSIRQTGNNMLFNVVTLGNYTLNVSTSSLVLDATNLTLTNLGLDMGGGDITNVGNITLNDSSNIIINTTTGSKIGTGTTQKLGFWNAPPVDQPAHITDPTGGATIDTEARTAINAILAQLAETGLQASS